MAPSTPHEAPSEHLTPILTYFIALFSSQSEANNPSTNLLCFIQLSLISIVSSSLTKSKEAHLLHHRLHH